jgi:hypothetical protein
MSLDGETMVGPLTLETGDLTLRVRDKRGWCQCDGREPAPIPRQSVVQRQQIELTAVTLASAVAWDVGFQEAAKLSFTADIGREADRQPRAEGGPAAILHPEATAAGRHAAWAPQCICSRCTVADSAEFQGVIRPPTARCRPELGA